MGWILPASVSMLVATSILGCAFAYLYSAYRERHLAFWAWACVFSAARFAALVAQSTAGKLLPLAVAYNVATIAGATLMLCGVRSFSSKKPGGLWLWFSAGAAAWGIWAPSAGLAAPTVSVPIFLLLGISYAVVGFTFLRSWPRPRPKIVNVTAALFVLWGVHQFDYPVLRFVDWFAPVGYLIGGTFALTTTIATILVYFERTRLLLAARTADLEAEVGIRWRAEAATRESDERFRAIFDMSPLGIGLLRDGRQLFTNAACAWLFGYPDVSAMVGEPLVNLLAPEVREEVVSRNRSRQAGADVVSTYETIGLRQDGTTFPMLVDATLVRLPDGPAVLTFFQDISAARRAADDLRKSEEKYRTLFDNAEVAMVRCRTETFEILDMNEKMRELLGWARKARADRAPIISWADPQEREALSTKLAAQGRVTDFEFTLVNARGELRTCLASAKLYPDQGALEASVVDITDRKQMEAEKQQLEANLRQAQKMEAVGTLAGGIAHDFNNILTPILAHGELALLRLPEGHPVREDISVLLGSAERAAELVRQILAISRREEAEALIPVNLGALAKETARFLRASLPSTIELRVEAAPNCGPVLGDPTRLQQVILNLCTNARDAMQDRGGILTISVAPEGVGTDGLRRVRMSVRDTGVGIPSELRGRVFEPYFTTKTTGKGTGLGLAVVHGIVTSLGGEVRIRSDVAQGTTLDVVLPEAERTEVVSPVRATELPQGRGQHVLVVDDEESVRNALEGLLGALGYRVTACASGAEALEAFRSSREDFDAVVTDYTMPGMTGLDFSCRLLGLRPNVPIILATGFAEGIDEQKARGLGLRALIMKPYTLHSLAGTLESALAV